MNENKLEISFPLLKEEKISLKEFAFLLTISQKEISLNDIIEKLLVNGYMGRKLEDGKYIGDFFISDKGIELLKKIQNESIDSIPKGKDLMPLAYQMQQFFPKGKKEGTNLTWRSSIKEIVDRLQDFFRKWGTEYSEEDILEATKNYVESFGEDTRYMHALKYFIWKDKKDNGIIEKTSELAAYVENKDDLKLQPGISWSSQLK